MSLYAARSTVGFLLLAAIAAPGAADLRLERTRLLEGPGRNGEVFRRELSEVIFVGDSSARFDTGPHSFIVRSGDGKFLWLNHEARTYAEVSLPLKLEDLFTEQERECVRNFPRALTDAEATVRWTEEAREIEGWKTRKLRIEGRHHSGLRFEDERWVTHGLPVDLKAYHLLVRNRAALSTRTRGWVGELLAEGGYPVETTTTLHVRGHQHVDQRRLTTVEEVEPDGSRYLPPTTYAATEPRPPIDLQCVSGTSRQ